MLKKIALITGINGQDGSYLAEFLLEKGYDVTLISDAHTTTGFEWDGYIVDAARVIDEQNTNFMEYSLPGRTARAVPVAEVAF